MNVLLIDDDALWRRTTRRMLEPFDIDEAESVGSGLTAARTKRYDALVVDVCLDGVGTHSGAEVAATMRAEEVDGVIVLVSGVVGPDLPQIAADAGADACLEKVAVAGHTLRRIVEQSVARRAEARASDARRQLPNEISALLGDVLAASEQERKAHAERSYRLALLASVLSRPGSRAAWRDSCARAVGVSAELLRQYAFTASRWPQGELRSLLLRGLSLSHLKELAVLPRDARARWSALCLERGLTVHDLRDALRDESGRSGGEG